MAEQFPSLLLGRWPVDLQASFAAVHLLLYVLAERGVVVDARPRLQERLRVTLRTIDRHLKTLREMDLVRGPVGRMQLWSEGSWPISDRSPRGADTSSDPAIDSSDPAIDSSDPAIDSSDPGVAPVAALTAKRSEARQAEPNEIDRILATAEIYVPIDDAGRRCDGRGIRCDDPHARRVVEQLLQHERSRDPVGVVERVISYVERFAELCGRDARERGFWGTRMLSVEVGRGRRASPWGVLKSAVDRASLQRTTSARVDAVVRPGRYGGGEATDL